MSDGVDLCGLCWGCVKVPFSKCKQLKLNSTQLTRDQDCVLSFAEDSCPHWNPFAIFCFYIDKCHPKATKCYARIIKPGCEDAQRLKKAFGKDIWFAEGGAGANWNMGPSKHRSLCKEIAALSGAERWESCTGHALRALCVTHCIENGLSSADLAAKVRHTSLNSQATCAKETSKRKTNGLAAVNPSGALATVAKKPKIDSAAKSATVPQVNDIEVVNDAIPETQPLLANNRSKFNKFVGRRSIVTAPKNAPVMVGLKEDTAIDEEKENESPNAKLQHLETENRILKFERENATLKAELAHHSVPPNDCRNSHPPTHPSMHQPVSGHCRQNRFKRFDYPDDQGHCHSGGCCTERQHVRQSFPPSHHEHHCAGPPRCHGARDSPDESFGEHEGSCHRRSI